MQKLRNFAMLLVASCTGVPVAAQAPKEEVIAVPGFGDFLAVDGKTVWMTNADRVEQWSRRGKLAAVPMSHPCGALTIAYRDLWVADCKDGTLNRIDPRTAKTIAAIPTGIGNATEGEMNVVAGAGSVWIASDKKGVISRVDPATNKVIATVTVAPETYYLAFGFGAVWAVSGPRQLLQRIEPASNKVDWLVPLGKTPGFLAAGAGAIWVQEQGDGTVARIDPSTGAVSGRVKVGEVLKYGDIDTGGGKVWLRTTEGQTMVVIDPANLAIRARVGKVTGSGALRYTKAGVWTTAHDQHTLSWWGNPAKIAK